MAQQRLSEATKKRVRARRLLRCGKSAAEGAEAVGVARQTVYTWKALLDEGGIKALRAVPERGRPAQLDAAQLASVRATILQSPTEHMHGVRFGQTQVWRILGSLGFSAQKPEKRAIERDEEAVRK